MKVTHVTLFIALLLIVAGLAGCGATAAPGATPTAASTDLAVPVTMATAAPPTATVVATGTAAAYTDPFAYCAVVGTIDAPGAAYTGPQAPEAVALGLQKAMDVPDTPLEVLQNGSFWRCVDGDVYACFVGANLPCEAKANTDRMPTQDEIDFCLQNPDSDFVPAVVTGRETVFEWRCRDGAPEIVKQVFYADAQGFISEFWYKISPAEAEATIQPLTVEVCNGQAQAMSHALGDLAATRSDEPLEDPIRDLKGIGCQATITGTGEQFESPWAVVGLLGSMLEEQGWTPDPMFVADGPTGTAAGYRKGEQLCLATAMWRPDDAANCPDDQPISACEVTPAQQLYTVTLNCGLESKEGGVGTEGGAEAGAEDIVFDSTRGGDYRDLYVMNSDGSDVSRLTKGETNNFAGPWSPDGQRIVYTTFGLTTSDIALIGADGSDQANLTNTPDVDEGFAAWSPNGTRIAFTTRRDGNNEIYLMDPDGSNLVRLTDDQADDFAPAWSPDGAQITFVSDRDREAGVYDLYVMNADGSGVTRLTDDDAIDYSPAWSPDGARIAFRSHHDGPADIYVINLDGSGLRNLTEDQAGQPADDWAPSWSPDGSRIAFQTNRDGNWEVYVMNADGTEAQNLTQNAAEDQLPFWRP